MRLSGAVAAGVTLGCLLFGGLYYRADRVASDRAAALVHRVSVSRTGPPVAAEADISALTDGVWRRTRAHLDFADGLARVTIGSGPGQVFLVDDGRRMWRLDAKAKTATAVGPSEESLDWSRVRGSYRATPTGSATVAGRLCQGVMLVSRRTGRPALALWIDPETNLVAKRATYDADGHLVALTELIRFDSAGQATAGRLGIRADWRQLDPQEQRSPSTTEADFLARAGFPVRPPGFVPRGYRRTGLYIRTCPSGCRYAELAYSDGLRVLSIYEHRPCGRGRMGRGQGRGRGWGCAGGPPDARPVLIDRGQAKTVRERRADFMVVVTGVLTEDDILRVVRSIP